METVQFCIVVSISVYFYQLHNTFLPIIEVPGEILQAARGGIVGGIQSLQNYFSQETEYETKFWEHLHGVFNEIEKVEFSDYAVESETITDVLLSLSELTYGISEFPTEEAKQEVLGLREGIKQLDRELRELKNEMWKVIVHSSDTFKKLGSKYSVQLVAETRKGRDVNSLVRRMTTDLQQLETQHLHLGELNDRVVVKLSALIGAASDVQIKAKNHAQRIRSGREMMSKLLEFISITGATAVYSGPLGFFAAVAGALKLNYDWDTQKRLAESYGRIAEVILQTYNLLKISKGIVEQNSDYLTVMKVQLELCISEFQYIGTELLQATDLPEVEEWTQEAKEKFTQMHHQYDGMIRQKLSLNVKKKAIGEN